MKKQKIVITGASGCVGQYITKWLIKNSDAELYLWLRDPNKLTAIDVNHPKINLLIGDLRQPEKFAGQLSETTRIIHTATAWGDPTRAYEINIVAIKKILRMLNPTLIEQIIYFSTASVIDENLRPISQAFTHGTEYIQTKAQCLAELECHIFAEKIIAVFPTLVFGGRVDGKSQFPTSYLTEGLTEAMRWVWLARWIKVFSKFHFIHAADIGFICGYLATNPHVPKEGNNSQKLQKLVLAQPYTDINEVIQTLLKWKGMKQTPQIPLWPWLIEFLIRILPIKINSWDRFSIKQRNFIYSQITSPETFGGVSVASSLTEVLKSSGLNHQ